MYSMAKETVDTTLQSIAHLRLQYTLTCICSMYTVYTIGFTNLFPHPEPVG